MQKVGSYLLTRRDGLTDAAARKFELERIQAEIAKWLHYKGESIDAPGTYRPEDGSVGTVTRDQARDGDRLWSVVHLNEITADGRRFVASVSVTAVDDTISVYATLETGSSAGSVVPVEFDPRCPKVVRSLLEIPGRWFHGTTQLKRASRLVGFESGEELVAEIADPSRSVPIVIISELDGEPALPQLDEKVAYDLVGLANVFVVDSDASWALTDHFGREFACFGGAIRVYWPRFSVDDDPFKHPLWTATRLRATELTPTDMRERLRRQLRSRLFRVAALSVVRPPAIDEIRNAASRRILGEVQARASSLEDFRALAETYASDNDQLRSELSTSQRRIDELEHQISALDADRSALLARVANAELQLRYREPEEQAVLPDSDSGKTEPGPPEDGEVRFYKKHYTTPNHDIFNRVADCGCNRWESAHKADKARKGILRLEQRSDFKQMHHCASCEGGGMWRVKW